MGEGPFVDADLDHVPTPPGEETMTRARALSILSLVPVLAGGCARKEPKVPQALATRASVAAPWVKVREPRGVSLLELPAQVLISPQTVGAVTPPYSARIVRIFVQPGQRVDKGSPVVEVVMPQLSGSAGLYAAAHTRLEAYGERKKQLEVLRAEGLARIADISEAAVRIAEARADQQSALAVLRSAGVSPADVPRILDSGGAVALRSPVKGVVTEVGAVLGETRESAGKPLARIVGEAPARIEARLSHRLPDGAKFEFISQAGEGFAVVLVAQAALVDPRDGTAPSWFEPQEARTLPAGLSGKLRVLLAEDGGAVVVPARAIGVRDSKNYVLVRRGAREERTPVKVLASSGADALVQSLDLQVGDEVAAEAAAFEEQVDAGS
jgi:cobalt-zinc-cadmium efflux system membrane fusion protein